MGREHALTVDSSCGSCGIPLRASAKFCSECGRRVGNATGSWRSSAAGNPFFAEEIVRDLAERAVLRGMPGDYVLTAPVGDVAVPATLQATIAARSDRLDPASKRAANAAAVIGLRFTAELHAALGVDPRLDELVRDTNLSSGPHAAGRQAVGRQNP
jgi:hypothetical protein